MREPTEFEQVTILLGTDRYRQEYIHDGVLEAQLEDGSWTAVGKLDSARVRAPLPEERLQALRLRVESAQHHWLIIREIVFGP